MISLLDSEFSQLNIYIESAKPSKIFILCDENTHEHCLPILLRNLTSGIPYEIIEIEPGEEMKNLQTAGQLWEILLENEADRKALLINLGGGVVTDLGGFVASTYKRGIKFINVPTSLLGMCDASIGGKTGIDHHFLKNLIGTFAEADETLVFPGFLKTLPEKELLSGFAEMLKHGLVANADHWNDLKKIEKIGAENIAPYIIKSMEIKDAIAKADFKEENIRKTLNFGHTVGHAIESLFLKSGNPITHGEAVAIGMICETKIAEEQNILSELKFCSIIAAIMQFFPYISIEAITNDQILSLMMNDKKNEDSKINFSLLTDIGKCSFDKFVEQETIVKALQYYRNLSKN